MTGRHATRSKNGCSTCRVRKIKCDEVRPLCGRCRSSQMKCEWLPSPPRRARSAAGTPPRSGSSAGACALVPRNQRILLPRDMFGFSAEHLGNSLHLSSMDREYLAYFPQSLVVKWVGKPWKWGFLRHLYTRTAGQSSIVMRMILAVSASELENRRITDPRLSGTVALPQNARAGMAHYSAALGELSALLARCHEQKLLPTQAMVDEVIAALFFMISYEHLFHGAQTGLRAHLSGVHAFLETCGVFRGQDIDFGPNFSHVAKNVLLLLMYVGMNYVALTGDGERKGWMTATARNGTLFSEMLDQLYQDTRDTNSLVFDGNYPQEALLDDIAVFQPLEFIHECNKLRHAVLPFTKGTKARDNNNHGDMPQHLARKLSQIGKRYNNLVRISQTDKPPEPERTRELQTIYYSVSEYHALQIVIHGLGCASNTDKQRSCGGRTCRVLQELVAKLTAVLKKLKSIDQSTLSRVCWPLAVAAEVVEDPAELLWIQETVNSSRMVTGSSTVFTFSEPS